MSADYGPAIWLPSPGRYWHGRNGDKPRYIILHGTAGGTSAQAIGNWLNTQTEREATSVHYVIGVDGQVVQLVSEVDSAWGNGVLWNGHDSWWTPNPNWYTISIEHCKPNADNSNALSPAQQEASFLLVRHLCEKWGIPKRAFNPAAPHDKTVGITGHFSIDPVERANCPGPYPWAQLDAFLNNGGGTVAGTPQGWTDDGTTLHAPNGHKVVLGFREYVRSHEWTPDNQPLEDERHRDQVEWHNPSLGAGQRQVFLRTALRWNNGAEGVKEEFLGSELLALEAELAKAQADYLALQKATQGQQVAYQTLQKVRTLVDAVQ